MLTALITEVSAQAHPTIGVAEGFLKVEQLSMQPFLHTEEIELF